MPGGFEDTKTPAKAQGGWTWVPPAQTGYQEEGTSLLPLGRYRMPDGSQQVSFGLPQGLLDAYRSVRYGLGYEQDPNAPKGYTSFDAMNKGAFGMAGGAITGSLGAGAARAVKSGLPRNTLTSGGAPEVPLSRDAYMKKFMPETWYHGTTHQFDEFADPLQFKNVRDYDNPLGRYEPEGHHGAAIYATSDQFDGYQNYGHKDGPDLSNRIEKFKEDIENKIGLDDGGKYLDLLRRAYKKATGKTVTDEHGPDYERDKLLSWYAKNKVAGDTDRVLELKARPENVVKVGGKDETVLPYQQGGHYIDEDGAAFVVKDAEGKVVKKFDDESDAYDLMDELNYSQEPQGAGATALDHLIRRVQEAGGDASPLDELRYTAVDWGGIRASEIEKAIRETDAAMYLIDNNVSAGQALQDAYRAAGYDGIILQNPQETFPRMGIGSQTKHLVMWEPNKFRDVNAKFDPAKMDSANLFAANPGTAEIVALLQKQRREQEKEAQRAAP